MFTEHKMLSRVKMNVGYIWIQVSDSCCPVREYKACLSACKPGWNSWKQLRLAYGDLIILWID